MPISGRNPADTTRPAGPSVVRLGGRVVDLDRQVVDGDGGSVRLRPRTADVLGYLIRHRGRIVAKQELIEGVWGDVAVTDDSLVQCLVEIRRALGPAQTAVRTVRGRGYLLDPAEPSAGAPAASATAPPDGRSEPPPRLRFVGLAALSVLAVTAALAGPSARATSGRPIGPSETLDDGARAAFRDGLTLLGASRAQVDLQRARALFARATTLDRDFAPAQAALGNVLVMLSGFGVERPAEALPEASAAARRAVALDPTLAAAWQALAHVQTQWDWDWPSAERSYRRAVALDPRSPFNMIFAHLLVGLGRTDEALAESDRWLGMDPASGMRLMSNCIVKYLARRYDDAVATCGRALDAAPPRWTGAHFWRALALSAVGEHAAAMDEALAARTDVTFTPTWVVGYVHARAGRLAEAREVLRAVQAHAASDYVPPVDLALLFTAVGDHDAALDWLERGWRERGRWMELVNVLPPLDPLRGDPRFRALVRRMRLPDPS
ncbi:MAG: winged helix-turn-helix domain-containing protein [Vicinamibacterales bacterium]